MVNGGSRLQQIENALSAPGGYFEIEEANVAGRPMRVFKNRSPSLRALVDGSRAHGERTYLVYEDRRISFAEHYQGVASVASALRRLYGVSPGDRVAILSANHPAWIVTFWATVSLGAIAVGLNGWWVRDEIRYGLADAEPKVLVGDRKRLQRLAPTDVSMPVVEIERDFQDLWTHDPDAALPAEPIEEDAAACILYTSGTTGRPKGVVNSHRNVIAVVGLQAFHGLRLLQYRQVPPPEAPALLVTNPLFHVSGLYAGAVIGLAMGVKTVWMEGRFDPVAAMRLIERERVSNWGPMGTVAHRFVHHPEVSRHDLSSVTSFGSGGAPVPQDLQQRLREVFPQAAGSAAVGYGLTECSALATMNFGEELEERPDSSGRPLPTVDVEIRDPSGAGVPEGVDGEVCIRGPMVMLGYWGKPEETRRIITEDGWLRTGDIGRIHHGHLFINARARDLILRGAENVFPGEIESRLLEHPGVAEAAVVGVDHEELGQEVKAYVVPREGEALDVQALAAWVGDRLAYYKVPSRWEVRASPLPRNAVGKVMKHLLSPGRENPFQEG